MAYQSIFSSNSGSSAAPSKSGGGGYSSIYGSATIQAPSPEAVAASRQQRAQAKQKQDDQAKAQQQAEAKQQASKAKQNSLFNQIKTGTKAFVNDAVVGTAKSAYDIASTVPKEAQVLKAKYGTPNDQKAQKQAVQNKKDVSKNIEEAKSLLRFAPRAAIQVGESIPVINKHPSENNTHVTDKAPQLVKTIFGKDPIPSIQKTYKDTKQKEGTGAAVGHTAATILGDALAFKGGKDAVLKTEKSAGKVKAAAGRDEAVNRLVQQSLFDISSKLRTPKKALDEAQAQQLATETAEKNKVAASKVDQKIELIEAKKADGKFTNVDKVKVKQLQAEKQQLTGDTAPSTTPKPLVADAAVPAKPEAQRQPQPTGQDRQVAAAQVAADTPSVTDAQAASRVYERLKAEHPELKDDVSYDAIKLKEDSQKAVDLLAKDKQKAFEIAMGQTPSTEVTSTAVNIAMAEKALQEGNHKLYAQLITNRSLAQTRRGQELVAEKGSVTDNSTARYVKELLASRLDKLGKKYMNDLDLSMKKLSPKERATAVIDKEVTKLEKQIKSRKLDTKTALSMLKELECL